nr:HigA family addiction module antitoxin [Rhodoferax sp.]
MTKVFEAGSAAGMQATHITRLRLQLAALHAAHDPDDLKTPVGWRLHSLHGDMKNRYALVALRIGVSRQAFSKLLNGKAGVSAEMAFRLAAARQTSAEFWLGLQQAFDLWQVRQSGPPKVQRLARD